MIKYQKSALFTRRTFISTIAAFASAPNLGAQNAGFESFCATPHKHGTGDFERLPKEVVLGRPLQLIDLPGGQGLTRVNKTFTANPSLADLVQHSTTKLIVGFNAGDGCTVANSELEMIGRFAAACPTTPILVIFNCTRVPAVLKAHANRKELEHTIPCNDPKLVAANLLKINKGEHPRAGALFVLWQNSKSKQIDLIAPPAGVIPKGGFVINGNVVQLNDGSWPCTKESLSVLGTMIHKLRGTVFNQKVFADFPVLPPVGCPLFPCAH